MFEVRWQQHRDGHNIQQTHQFSDKTSAQEFAQGLGERSQAEVFDLTQKDSNAVWSFNARQATQKERDAAKAAAVVGQAEGSGPNTDPDTRGDAPQDLKEVMGNQPRSPAQTASPMSQPTGAAPQGARQLDADQAGTDRNSAQRPQDGSGGQDGSSDSSPRR